MTLHVISYACGGNTWLIILSYFMIRTQTRILHRINPYKIQKNKIKYVRPWQPPLGFNFNRRVNFVPCVITNSEGRGVPARYTRVIMGPDPHVIGIIPGNRSQYSGPLYMIPDHDQGERPRYAHDNLWCFKYGADERVWFNNALEHIHNLSLTTKVTCFREASRCHDTTDRGWTRLELFGGWVLGVPPGIGLLFLQVC